MLLPALSLCKRELTRFLRQRTRIIGSLATPILFWLFIGAGMGRSFAGEGLTHSGGYMEYFFPGTVVMILLFTAIFSTISIIEDRKEGFLQSVLVVPVPGSAIVMGKVLGGTILAFGQGMLFLALAPLVGIKFTLIGFLVAMLIMLLVSFGLTALGFCIAWRMSSTQGFHAIMNLFLMPMWFLSGALFPPGGAVGGLGKIMAVNPLSYGLAGIRRAMYWGDASVAAKLPGWPTILSVTILFSVGMFVLASVIARGRIDADLQ